MACAKRGSTSLRSVSVLDVLSKYASARLGRAPRIHALPTAPRFWHGEEFRLAPGYVASECKIREVDIVSHVNNTSQQGKSLRLLYVGRFSTEKGLTTLLRAIHLMPDAIELTLVGSGLLEPQLRAFVAKLRLGTRVHFNGPLPWGEAVFTLMRQHDALVLPSYTEGLPLVIPEAFSQGLPVIASSVGGVPEVVQHHVTGILCRPGSSQDIVEAACSLLESPAKRQAMAVNCIKKAMELTFDKQTGLLFQVIGAHLRLKAGLSY